MNQLSRRTKLREAIASRSSAFKWVGIYSACINLLMLVPSVFMLQVYDRVLVSRSIPTLVALGLITLFLLALMGSLEWIRTRLLVRVGNQLDVELAGPVYQATFRRIIDMPGSSRVQGISDLSIVRQNLTGSALFALFDAPWTIVFAILLFLIHPAFGVTTIAGGLVLLGLAYITERRSHAHLSAATAASNAATRSLDAQLRNWESLAAMGMTGAMYKCWRAALDVVAAEQSAASDVAAGIGAVSRMLRIALQSLILAIGAYLAIEHIVSPGIMIAASIIAGRILSPFDQLIRDWQKLALARDAWNRLQDLLAHYPGGQVHMPLPPPAGQITLEEVSLCLPGAKAEILKDITLNVPAGQALAIVGPSGAGKSTFLRVIAGVVRPQQGSVRLDQSEINAYDAEVLGRAIGYLPQSVELFEGTIAENIARFREPDAEAVLAAARLAGVDTLIRRLPDGYDTHLDEAASQLSAGQKQRIGLARALYGDPSIIILDEPNSNLDDEGERALADALGALRNRGATVLVVSHRPSILQHVDMIAVLKEGRIQAYGPRAEILSRLMPIKATLKQVAKVAE